MTPGYGVHQPAEPFSCEGRSFPYYSPHMIMSGWHFDYAKHCQVPFGAYVLACNENNLTNDNCTHAINAIYLCPLNNMQGGHEVMDLHTGQKISCCKVTKIPMTEHVIKAIETMAYDQGFKDLKILNHHNVRFYPAEWIAGVDYNNNNNNDNYNNVVNNDGSDDEDPEYEVKDVPDDGIDNTCRRK